MKFKNVIEEMLIVESDKRSTIQSVFGFNEEWANEFHRINPKLSVWVADSFLKDFLSNKTENLTKFIKSGKVDEKGAKKGVVDFLNQNPPSKNAVWKQNYEPSYRYIMDWLTSPRRREQVNVKELTFKTGLEKSTEWHDSLEGASAKDYKEANEIVFDYRNNQGVGYYWVNLKTHFSDEESDRMGHCGRDSGCTLFSLRSIDEYKEGRSHITASYSTTTKKLNQIKGRKNSKPKRVYFKYIIDLILNDKYPVIGFEKKIYNYDNNFQLNDLNEDELNNIFSKNKDVKIDYLFGDKTKLYGDVKNEDIKMFKDGASKQPVYGIVNVETLEVIKDYEYVIDEKSEFSDFVFPKKLNQWVTMKHFVSIKSDKDMILLIHKNKFQMVSKEKAKELLDDSEDIDSSNSISK